jgi:maltooligosyltrehalose trehalohydrolase
MHVFEIWAPRAHNVSVKIGDTSHAMKEAEGGWWRTQISDAGPGTDYLFVIDDGDALPDPRSAYQPFGVNGPSRVIDHSAFRWTDKQWQARPLASALIYELHVGTFTPEGTFRSAISKLDHLVDLGVTHVEIMPVAEFSGEWGWGYDGVDLFAPHHEYGSPDDLKTLVNACHENGLAVLLDVVYNHLGPAGNYLSRFGPYFTGAYQTPWGEAVNLDHRGSHEVRRFFVDNAVMWMREYHFDGLRLDAVHAFVDNSAIHFLELLSTEVDILSAHLGRHLVLIAESDLNDPRIVTSREAGGYGIDAHWDDEFHHALHSLVTGETNGYYEDYGKIQHFAQALENAYVYAGTYSVHRGRVHGRSIDGLWGRHFVVFAQNHDQIGNRARGERLCHLTSLGRQKIGAAAVLTSPFVPMLFQGEEFCASSPFQYFSNHSDPELARSVSEGRKNEFKAFGWDPSDVPDPQDPQTFRNSKLKWEEAGSGEHAELLAWYKKLIALRRRSSALTDDRLERVEVNCDEEGQWLTMRRGDIEVVYNFHSDAQAIPVSLKSPDVLCSEGGWKLRPQQIELPPDSVAILTAMGASKARTAAAG